METDIIKFVKMALKLAFIMTTLGYEYFESEKSRQILIDFVMNLEKEKSNN